jgi:hypothetical protein
MSVEPSYPATFTETSSALGATPENLPSDAFPLPAIRPAMNEPCPKGSLQLFSDGADEGNSPSNSPEKSSQ